MHTNLDCKCHGVSGSCQVKTCWKVMAPFGVVGSYLRKLYHNGVLVTVDQSGNELVMADRYPFKPPRDDLVFLEDSPDYCVPNSNTGSLGTTGRVCNRTIPGHGSCGVLCCGRGFNTIQIEEEYKCACKFHWCCSVKCKTCRRTVDKHMCKSPEDDVPVYNSALQVSAAKQPTNLHLNNQNRPPKNSKKNSKRRKTKKRGASGTSSNSLDGGNLGNKML